MDIVYFLFSSVFTTSPYETNHNHPIRVFIFLCYASHFVVHVYIFLLYSNLLKRKSGNKNHTFLIQISTFFSISRVFHFILLMLRFMYVLWLQMHVWVCIWPIQSSKAPSLIFVVVCKNSNLSFRNKHQSRIHTRVYKTIGDGTWLHIVIVKTFTIIFYTHQRFLNK